MCKQTIHKSPDTSIVMSQFHYVYGERQHIHLSSWSIAGLFVQISFKILSYKLLILYSLMTARFIYDRTCSFL